MGNRGYLRINQRVADGILVYETPRWNWPSERPARELFGLDWQKRVGVELEALRGV